MTAVTSFSASPEDLPSPDGETEAKPGVEQKVVKPLLQLEADAERIKSAVARLTSTSIEGLEGLASELQNLQTFLHCEVERVQNEIESALAGINIIIETIAPWKSILIPPATAGARPMRSGPVPNMESNLLRR